MLQIRKGWLGLWKVYQVGHLLGDDELIATFRYEHHATMFVESLCQSQVGQLP